MNRGFALVAVLWVLVVTSGLVLADEVVTRDAEGASRNRIALIKAQWSATGCAAQVLGRLDAALTDNTAAPLDSVAATSDSSCQVSIAPVGTGLDANKASEDELVTAFEATGLNMVAADSLAESLEDWRDADSTTRPLGAETEWYASQHRVTPRDSQLADTAELRLVRGFSDHPQAARVLTVDSQRVAISRAGSAVLSALPGFTPELVAAVLQRREYGPPLRNLSDLPRGISHAALDSLSSRFGQLVKVATVAPDAWVMRVQVSDGVPPVLFTIELRIVTVGDHASVVRHRQW